MVCCGCMALLGMVLGCSGSDEGCQRGMDQKKKSEKSKKIIITIGSRLNASLWSYGALGDDAEVFRVRGGVLERNGA